MTTTQGTAQISWEYLMSKRRERMASYIRESDISLADSTTIESQAKACREYGERQGYLFNPEHEFKEAISGYTVVYTERRVLLKMLEAAKHHEFDVLVVSEIRALGRKQVEIFVIYDQLQKYGVRLETISEKFEDSAMGRLILSLRAAFSEIEHDQILLRLQRGRNDRVEIGQAINGHSQAGYGHIFIDSAREQKASYALDTRVIFEDNDLKWTPVTVIRFMRDLLFQGYSVRKIAFLLTDMGIPNPDLGKIRKGKPVANVWHWATIYRLLTDPRIMGVVYANKTQRVNGKRTPTPQQQVRLPDCPSIITPEEFAKIQEQLQVNKLDSPRNNKSPREEMGLFRSGYCVCAICQYRMTVRYHKPDDPKRPNPEYICRRKTGQNDAHFHNTIISQPLLDREGWKHAVEIICNPSTVRERVSAFRQQNTTVIDTEAIEATICRLQQEMQNLFNFAKLATDADSIARLGQMLNELETQKQKAQSLLYSAEEEEEENLKIEAEIARFEKWAQEVRPKLGNHEYAPDYTEQRLAIRILGLRAFVLPANGNHPFRYRFELAPPEIMKLLLSKYSDSPLRRGRDAWQ